MKDMQAKQQRTLLSNLGKLFHDMETMLEIYLDNITRGKNTFQIIGIVLKDCGLATE